MPRGPGIRRTHPAARAGKAPALDEKPPSADTVMAWPLLGLIWLYRHTLSPLMGVNCRFAPTCSEYASGALRQHGAIKGSWLALKRISRCHPWGGSGYDPVPRRQDGGETRGGE